ncbi:MAG TPA: hypothetical protein PKE26_10330 [Kiritimatiellia bacterium]|nr:hypothetical protein [Kiritimatiellia bacterium]HMO99494.1 hypothetical protein [Kiritimatiellia bacterium]HMP97817.1 hypothetical protein [Kiritimatiellia bacterium]
MFSVNRIRLAILIALLAGVNPQALIAQDVPAVSVRDLKQSPQRFWAGLFVFNDVLKEMPGGKTQTIDSREVVRFATRDLGEVYVERDALPLFEALEVGSEYLLVGTVSQREKSFAGLFRRGGSFVVIVRDVLPVEKSAADIPELLAEIDRDQPTNEFNRVFLVLEDIMGEIHKDIFGYASNQNIPMSEVFSQREHRDRLATGVRSALRRYEDRNRTTSQELFVNVLLSMIALQHGYVDLAQPAYQPDLEAPDAPASLETPAEDAFGDPESWGLTDPAPEPDTPAPEADGETLPVE